MGRVLEMKTIQEIINAKTCGDIFERGTKQYIKKQYHQLVHTYHPDVCANAKADDVMAKLNEVMSGKDVDTVAKSWDGSTSMIIKDSISGLTSASAKNELIEF